MAYTIVENVRGFFISRPPLVVFMICLGSFAIALITFAYIVKVKDMPNPDITEVGQFSLLYHVLKFYSIWFSPLHLESTVKDQI